MIYLGFIVHETGNLLVASYVVAERYRRIERYFGFSANANRINIHATTETSNILGFTD